MIEGAILAHLTMLRRETKIAQRLGATKLAENRHHEGMKRANVLSKQRVFTGFFGVDQVKVEFEKRDGSMSEPVSRLSVERGDAAAALVYDRESRCLLLVNQFRYPMMRHGEEWLTEIVAGSIKDGEPPEEAIRREILEEIGYKASALLSISKFISSPGGMSEVVHLYYTEVTAKDRVTAGGGAEDEDEDVEIVRLSIDEAIAMAEDGRLTDGKTLLALYWLKSHRPRR